MLNAERNRGAQSQDSAEKGVQKSLTGVWVRKESLSPAIKIIPGPLIPFDQYPDRLEGKKEEIGAGERKANS